MEQDGNLEIPKVIHRLHSASREPVIGPVVGVLVEV